MSSPAVSTPTPPREPALLALTAIVERLARLRLAWAILAALLLAVLFAVAAAAVLAATILVKLGQGVTGLVGDARRQTGGRP